MQIILLDNIDNLGKLGDLRNVRPGYARNYLFPQGRALPATEESKRIYEARREELEKQVLDNMEKTAQQAEKVKELILRFSRRASDEGKLYGSVSLDDVVNELARAGITVEKRQIIMPNGTLRHTGEYAIQLRFDAENVADIPLEINPETGG